MSSNILKGIFFFWAVGLNSQLKIFSKPSCKQIFCHPGFVVPLTEHGFRIDLAAFFFFFFFLEIHVLFYLFIYLWLCWVFVSVQGLSPVAASGDHSSSRCAGLSLSRPLLLRSTGSRCAGSATVAHGPSRSVACGIFPDRGSNPCPLHWQADSQPLRHQGSPSSILKGPRVFRMVSEHWLQLKVNSCISPWQESRSVLWSFEARHWLLFSSYESPRWHLLPIFSLNLMSQPLLASNFPSEASSPLSALIEYKTVRVSLWVRPWL